VCIIAILTNFCIFCIFRMFCIILLKFAKKTLFLNFFYYNLAKFHKMEFSNALQYFVKTDLLILWHTVLSTTVRCLKIMCLCFRIACTLVLYMPHFCPNIPYYNALNCIFFKSCCIFFIFLPHISKVSNNDLQLLSYR